MAVIGGKEHGLRTRGTFNVGIKLDGDWVKFNHLIENSDHLLRIAAREGQRKFAEAYRDKVKDNIKTGGKRFGYPDTTPDYTLRKIKHGGGSRNLIWDENFLDAVEIMKPTVRGNWGVGIKRNVTRGKYFGSDKNKLTISEYANVLEHGTKYMPARPIFSDTFTRTNGGMGGKAGVRKFITSHIVKYFRTIGIKVTI